MAQSLKVLCTEQKLEEIAEAIREKKGVSVKYTLDEMPPAIRSIPTGGDPPTGQIDITDITESGQGNPIDVTNYALAYVNSPALRAENIRRGTVILGVAGTYGPSGTKSVSMATTSVVTEDVASFENVSIQLSGAANITPENIRSGVTFLGVTGSYAPPTLVGTASPADVRATKSFYSDNYTLQMGTMANATIAVEDYQLLPPEIIPYGKYLNIQSGYAPEDRTFRPGKPTLSGDAVESQVLVGCTFYSTDVDMQKTGQMPYATFEKASYELEHHDTLAAGQYLNITAGYNSEARSYKAAEQTVLTGNANPEDVIFNKTFYSNNYAKQTGTMPTVAFATHSIDPSQGLNYSEDDSGSGSYRVYAVYEDTSIIGPDATSINVRPVNADGSLGSFTSVTLTEQNYYYLFHKDNLGLTPAYTWELWAIYRSQGVTHAVKSKEYSAATKIAFRSGTPYAVSTYYVVSPDTSSCGHLYVPQEMIPAPTFSGIIPAGQYLSMTKGYNETNRYFQAGIPAAGAITVDPTTTIPITVQPDVQFTGDWSNDLFTIRGVTTITPPSQQGIYYVDVSGTANSITESTRVTTGAGYYDSNTVTAITVTIPAINEKKYYRVDPVPANVTITSDFPGGGFTELESGQYVKIYGGYVSSNMYHAKCPANGTVTVPSTPITYAPEVAAYVEYNSGDSGVSIRVDPQDFTSTAPTTGAYLAFAGQVSAHNEVVHATVTAGLVPSDVKNVTFSIPFTRSETIYAPVGIAISRPTITDSGTTLATPVEVGEYVYIPYGFNTNTQEFYAQPPIMDGTAISSHVLIGETFYSNTLTKQTGTMPTISIQRHTINPSTGLNYQEDDSGRIIYCVFDLERAPSVNNRNIYIYNISATGTLSANTTASTVDSAERYYLGRGIVWDPSGSSVAGYKWQLWKYQYTNGVVYTTKIKDFTVLTKIGPLNSTYSAGDYFVVDPVVSSTNGNLAIPQEMVPTPTKWGEVNPGEFVSLQKGYNEENRYIQVNGGTLTGNAIASHVLTGETFYSDDYNTKHTGTMPYASFTKGATPSTGALVDELSYGQYVNASIGYNSTVKSFHAPSAPAEGTVRMEESVTITPTPSSLGTMNPNGSGIGISFAPAVLTPPRTGPYVTVRGDINSITVSIPATISAGLVNSGVVSTTVIVPATTGDNVYYPVQLNRATIEIEDAGLLPAEFIEAGEYLNIYTGYNSSERTFRAKIPTLTGTASAADVRSGETFYNNSYNIVTGTMPDSNVTVDTSASVQSSDVDAGKFVNIPKGYVGSTLTYYAKHSTLTGNAITSQVLTGREFYSNNATQKLTGTMPYATFEKASYELVPYETLNAGQYLNVTAGYNSEARTYRAAAQTSLTGNALPEEVVSGRTFYSNSYEQQTGTMPTVNIRTHAKDPSIGLNYDVDESGRNIYCVFNLDSPPSTNNRNITIFPVDEYGGVDSINVIHSTVDSGERYYLGRKTVFVNEIVTYKWELWKYQYTNGVVYTAKIEDYVSGTNVKLGPFNSTYAENEYYVVDGASNNLQVPQQIVPTPIFGGTIPMGRYLSILKGYNDTNRYYQAASPTLSGDAQPNEVLAGKKFYSDSMTIKTGTLAATTLSASTTIIPVTPSSSQTITIGNTTDVSIGSRQATTPTIPYIYIESGNERSPISGSFAHIAVSPGVVTDTQTATIYTSVEENKLRYYYPLYITGGGGETWSYGDFTVYGTPSGNVSDQNLYVYCTDALSQSAFIASAPDSGTQCGWCESYMGSPSSSNRIIDYYGFYYCDSENNALDTIILLGSSTAGFHIGTDGFLPPPNQTPSNCWGLSLSFSTGAVRTYKIKIWYDSATSKIKYKYKSV